MFHFKSRLIRRKKNVEEEQQADTTSDEDSKDDSSFSASLFEAPIPYEAVVTYPPGYNPPKKLTSNDLSGVRIIYVIVMAVLSFAQLLHGSRYIGQCRLSPSMPFILILEGILGVLFCLEESWPLIRSVKLSLSINGILSILYTITAFQVILTFQPEYYEMESIRHCNVHFYNGTLLISVIQAGIEFMLVVYMLILNSTF